MNVFALHDDYAPAEKEGTAGETRLGRAINLFRIRHL